MHLFIFLPLSFLKTLILLKPDEIQALVKFSGIVQTSWLFISGLNNCFTLLLLIHCYFVVLLCNCTTKEVISFFGAFLLLLLSYTKMKLQQSCDRVLTWKKYNTLYFSKALNAVKHIKHTVQFIKG